MKDFVFHNRIGVAGSVVSMAMLAWAMFVVPGGAPWTGIVWLVTLGAFLALAAGMLVALKREPSMSSVLRGIDHEPAKSRSPRTRPVAP